ncbi:MAG: hypothetical protein RIQ88_298 [Actinomycetota bacterium]|jgi:hypothetical protein
MEPKKFGLGNLVIALYAVFALSATVRGTYQIYRKFQDAPLAYSLSLLAGIVYVVATIALLKRNFRLAKATMWFELVGVITIGFLSILIPAIFAHPTVWSFFGMGYGFIPLALPIFGLIWLRKSGK